jgi:hypothetical protein
MIRCQQTENAISGLVKFPPWTSTKAHLYQAPSPCKWVSSITHCLTGLVLFTTKLGYMCLRLENGDF